MDGGQKSDPDDHPIFRTSRHPISLPADAASHPSRRTTVAVAVATIMDATFAEYDAWYAEALQYNWGWGDYEPARLADAFRTKPEGSPISGNGKSG